MQSRSFLWRRVAWCSLTVPAYGVGEAQAFSESPAAFCVQTHSNFTWDWEGRMGPMPFMSSCEVCASQDDGLTQYSAKMQDSRVFLLLAGTKLSACWWWLCPLVELMPFPWHWWSKVCLYLTALVSNVQLVETERKDKAGICCVLQSLWEITATTAVLAHSPELICMCLCSLSHLHTQYEHQAVRIRLKSQLVWRPGWKSYKECRSLSLRWKSWQEKNLFPRCAPVPEV